MVSFKVVGRLFLTSLLGAAMVITPAMAADDHPYKIEPELDQAIKAGLHELYNFNFDKSLSIFKQIESQEKEHPMIAFGVASVYWWRVSTRVLDCDKEASQPFLDAVNHCIEVSSAKVKAGDPTGEGHLALGGALGLLGRWQASNREWMGAYFKGKKAYKHLVEALEVNPRLLDANMGKGIFDYFVAALPSAVRVLAFLGMGNDRQVGIRELKEASENGIYSRTPSALFLADIYSNAEGTPEKALPILQAVQLEYPQSFFIHMMRIIALYNAGDIPGIKTEALSFQDKIAKGTYSNEAIASGHFAMGLSHFKGREWSAAAADFQRAAQVNDPKDPWVTWGRLYLGYCYDALDQREQAKTEYKKVVEGLRRWASQDNAKDRLKNPFRGTDEDLKKLKL